GLRQDFGQRAAQGRGSGHHSAGTRENEDGDGSAHLPFQDFHGRVFAGARRSVAVGGGSPRRVGLLCRERWVTEAAAGALSRTELRQLAGVTEVNGRATDRGYHRVYRDD